MQSFVCGGCRTLIGYPAGATLVACGQCNHIQNVQQQQLQALQVACPTCRTVMMFPQGTQTGMCAMCHQCFTIPQQTMAAPTIPTIDRNYVNPHLQTSYVQPQPRGQAARHVAPPPPAQAGSVAEKKATADPTRQLEMEWDDATEATEKERLLHKR